MSPTIVVIFGEAGDLTWRKLIPSLFDLHRDRRMPTQFAIMAVDRAAFSKAEVHTRFLDGVKQFSRQGKVTRSDWHDFAGHIPITRGFHRPGSVLGFAKEVHEIGKGVEGDRRSHFLHGHPAYHG